MYDLPLDNNKAYLEVVKRTFPFCLSYFSLPRAREQFQTTLDSFLSLSLSFFVSMRSIDLPLRLLNKRRGRLRSLRNRSGRSVNFKQRKPTMKGRVSSQPTDRFAGFFWKVVCWLWETLDLVLTIALDYWARTLELIFVLMNLTFQVTSHSYATVRFRYDVTMKIVKHKQKKYRESGGQVEPG